MAKGSGSNKKSKRGEAILSSQIAGGKRREQHNTRKSLGFSAFRDGPKKKCVSRCEWSGIPTAPNFIQGATIGGVVLYVCPRVAKRVNAGAFRLQSLLAKHKPKKGQDSTEISKFVEKISNRAEKIRNARV